MAHRMTKDELDHLFEQFLKESVSDDSFELGSSASRPSVLDQLGKVQPKPVKTSQVSVPWWQDDDNEMALRKGLLSSGKTFRKSLRKSQPIQEVDEEQQQERFSENTEKPRVDAVIFSRDSLEPEESLVVSQSRQSEEDFALDEKDKARFFASLEKGSESLDDDPRLNEVQESSNSTVASAKRERAVSVAYQGQRENGERDSVKGNTPSPAYSEDFEDEVSEKKAEEKKPERRGMLAKGSLNDFLNDTDADLKAGLVNYAADRNEWPNSQKVDSAGPGASVSLYDSLNSTNGGPLVAVEHYNTDSRPNSRMVEAAGPGQSYGQSGASEVEALQEAYLQISRSVAECEDDRVQQASRSPVSPATPECSAGTFKHVSTAGSDLPTAEELMRAIGPESGFTYGLSLEPQIVAVGDASAERMTLDGSPIKANNLIGAHKESPVVEPHTATHQNRHRSVTEELHRLMQEDYQERPSPSVSSKGKKQQAPDRSTRTRPFSSVSRKAPVPPEKMKKAEIKLLTKPSAPSRTGRIAKPPCPQAQRKSQMTNKTFILNQTNTVKGSDSSLRVSSEFITSVKSFAAFLEHQMEAKPDCPVLSDNTTEQTTKNGNDLVKAAPIVGQDLDFNRSSLEQLSLQLAQNERQLLLREEQLQQDHSREISALKQENYILRSKLRSAEEASKQQQWRFGEASDTATEEKLRQIEKEMKEQETLIHGYHLENEKLYMQMKALRAQSKQNEEAMFTENQRLLSELAFTKEELNRINKQKTVGGTSASDQGYSVTELLVQVQALERREEKLQEEFHRLKQEKQALHLDLQMMKKERDLAKVQVIYTSGDKGFEMKLLEERHKEEVSALKKRLQWYAENQELLDKDAARLRAASAETQKLTEQVERLKMEVAKRANLQEKKARERAGEAKRVLDLERQVKEMEEILRRRHPNSLPALIYAAAAAGGQEGESSHQHAASQPSQTAALLERRIQRLEAELEGRDEEAKRSLRAMEQQFQRIKLQYEQQISELEQQLAERTLMHQDGLPQESRTTAELEQLKQTHQSQVNALKVEIASLQEKVQQNRSSAEPEKPSPGPSRHQLQAEAAQATRIERLTHELSAKSRTIQELHRTVERLQRERRTMLSAPRVEGSSTKPKQQHSGPAKDPVPVPKPAETFPPTQDEKDYQPRTFSGSHISEVQQENDRLMLRQEQLELQREQERISMQAAITQLHNDLKRIQERSAEQLASLKAEHQREKEHLVARHALEHSSSKVAELTNQMKTQEIMVLHLREQLKELQDTKDALAVSKLREETLQNQLAKLLEELKQAKEVHTPELRHFTSLEHKITSMELRYQQREQELQQVIAQTRSVVEQEQQAEVARWKKLAQGKTSELEAFRLELDSILDVLRELQRQGVVIPATQHSSDSGVIFRPLRS